MSTETPYVAASGGSLVAVPSAFAMPNVLVVTQHVVVAQAVPRPTDGPLATGVISGVMTNADGPLAFARVMLMRDGSLVDDRVLTTMTDASGNYSFTQLPPGDYVVVPFDPAGAYRSKVAHTGLPYPLPTLSGHLAPGAINNAYSSSIVVVDSYGRNGVWSLGSGHPTGWTINATTGLITGTTTIGGDYTFDVTFTDGLGRAVSSSQTVHVDSDALYANVIANLDFSVSTTDDKAATPSVWTTHGGVVVQDGQLALDGVDDYVSTTSDSKWQLGSADFVIELDVTPNVTPTGDVFFAEQYAGSGAVAFAIATCNGSIAAGGDKPFFGFYTGSAWVTAISAVAMVAGKQSKFAAERVGNLISFYQDGTSVATIPLSAGYVMPGAADEIYIGKRWDNGGAPFYARANVNRLRVTTNGHRFNGNYAVSTEIYGSLPNAVKGVHYNVATPYYNPSNLSATWSVYSGSLPSWASLDTTTGVVSGDPTAAGTSGAFVLKAIDSTGHVSLSASQTLTVVTLPQHINNFDGTNGSTVLTDAVSGTWTTGSGYLDTSKSKFGVSSLRCPQSGAAATLLNDAALDFGTGDFCIEGFVTFNSFPNGGLFHLYPGVPPGNAFGVAVGYDGSGFWSIYNDTNSANRIASTAVANTPAHFAAYRINGTMYFGFAGTVYTVGALPTNISASQINWGMYYSTSYPMDGWLDAVRTTKGSGIYPTSGTYTPPAIAPA